MGLKETRIIFTSNWSLGLSAAARNSTNLGMVPVAMSASIGGLRSRDRIFRADCTAANCTAGSSDDTPDCEGRKRTFVIVYNDI